MIEKKPLDGTRVRKIDGSFAFVEHRFLQDGFWTSLSAHEILLYLFLVLVSDRHGLSYYSYDKICTLLRLSLDEYVMARNELIAKDLVAFDGYLYQVLSLPVSPKGISPRRLRTPEQMLRDDPATVRQVLLKELCHDAE
jgi:hypothetical protein